MTVKPETIRGKLPPIYAPLFSEAFDRPALIESRATCDDCAMCDKGQPSPVPMEYFQPDLKCCTYHPYLPNFLVGAILADPAPELEEGRRRIRAKIAGRTGVTPRWISPPRKYSVLMEASRGNGFFGRSKAALCPYFDERDGGRCTVWKYRDNVCSTYFCKYTNGKLGWDFWTSLKDYLGHVEKMLSGHAALAVDPSANDAQVGRGKLTIEDLEDRPPSEAEYSGLWGKWIGREEEFFIACHDRVRAMTREEFTKVVDETPDGRKHLQAIAERHDIIHTLVLPQSLVRNPKMREKDAGENVVVTTYSVYDSFSLEKELYEVLGTIRGTESLEANLARLAEEGIELAPDLLKYLFTHGVLVAVVPKKPPEMCAVGPAPKT
jgi:hypothetical protein